jgi:hypothetical protein
VAQVRVGGVKAPRAGGARVFEATVGGLKVRAGAAGWSNRRKTPDVRVAVTRVTGESSRLRNVVFLIARKRDGARTRTGGKVQFTIANASPVVTSFWVLRVGKDGRADVFRTPNAISTALHNWSKYLLVLKAAQALKAAQKPVDATGELASTGTAAAAPAKLHMAGTKVSGRSIEVLRLLYGTVGDRDAFQATKRSPLATQFIARDLNNPRLAARWEKVVGVLPEAVPDKYAASAQQEAKFGNVTAPRISSHRVVIADSRNASSQAAIETPRVAGDTLPGAPVEIRFQGTGRGWVWLNAGTQTCEASCAHFYTSGQGVVYGSPGQIRIEAHASAGSHLESWQGCTGGTTGNDHGTQGYVCRITADTTRIEPKRTVIVTFEADTPPAPQPPRTFESVPPSSGSSSGGGGGGGGGTPSAPRRSRRSSSTRRFRTPWASASPTSAATAPGTPRWRRTRSIRARWTGWSGSPAG